MPWTACLIGTTYAAPITSIPGIRGSVPTARSGASRDALVAAGLATVVVLLARWGPDWPAQQFRAGLASHVGLHVWNDRWYGGQPLPGYSVLYPLIASLIGAQLTGLLAVTAAAVAASHLVPGGDARRHRLFGLSVALLLAGSLVIGQVPFLLGVALGLWGLLALRAERNVATWVLVAASSLASPLAGIFLLMAAPSLAAVYTWRRVLPLSVALVGPAVAVVVGGAGGPEPYPWPSLCGVLAFCLGSWLLTESGERVLRRFAVVYAVVGIVVFLAPNPVGGNIARIGKLVALPVACVLIDRARRARRLHLAGVAIAALLWPLVPLTSAIAAGARDPSQSAAYYTGLLSYLRTQDPITGRLEIPFTRAHWEAARVAPFYPLARGEERQTDLQYNSVLYKPLTPARYQQWLRQSAVSLVALPSVPLDYSGIAEGNLLRRKLPYLRQVWSDSHWTVWKVLGAQPLVSGPARISRMGPASFEIVFWRGGTSIVRIRASQLWRVTEGTGCVEANPYGWLEVHAPAPQVLTLRAEIITQLIVGAPDCDGD